MTNSLVTSPDTLSPLPSHVREGLMGVSILAALSLVASSGLFFILLIRIMNQWLRTDSRKKSRHTNQFVWLIFNLVFADIQQACAFVINAHWLVQNAVVVGTDACWMQGWFVSVGDLASGVWCTAIGLHTFAGVIFSYQLPMRWFYALVVFLWVFIYGMALIGIGMYGNGIFVRAGAWCWVDSQYPGIRLFTHYLWIFVAEFGNFVLYGLIFFVLRIRIRQNYFATPEAAAHAHTVAKVMVVYPVVYVVCTLPLAALRMASQNSTPSLPWFCAAGAMITSNGFLDVLIYTLTRRLSIFDEPEEEYLDSFQLAWQRGASPAGFGTTTVITGGAASHSKEILPLHHDAKFPQKPQSSAFTSKLRPSVFSSVRSRDRPTSMKMADRSMTPSTEDLMRLPATGGQQDWNTGQRTVTVTVEHMTPEDQSVIEAAKAPVLEAMDSFDEMDQESLGSMLSDWKET